MAKVVIEACTGGASRRWIHAAYVGEVCGLGELLDYLEIDVRNEDETLIMIRVGQDEDAPAAAPEVWRREKQLELIGFTGQEKSYE